jgi:hypothetical protein
MDPREGVGVVKLPAGWWSAEPGARPYVHRDHWVADLAGVVLFVAIVVAAWVVNVALFDWSLYTATMVTLVWLWVVVASMVANSAQAWLWRRSRRIRRRS